MKPLLLLLLLGTGIFAVAQPTVGLLQYDIPNTDGYVLFSPMQTNKTFLINKCGEKVNEWDSQYSPGLACYLLEDGSLLRAGIDPTNTSFGISGGIIEKRDWNGNLTWLYSVSNLTECQHHDIHAMPNGNILVIAWEMKTKAEAIAAGRRPALTGDEVWSEKIIEIQPTGPTTGNIVWEWRLWDHLVQHWDSTKANYGIIADHPELVNINQFALPGRADWIHMNSVDYNPTLDQIVMSCHVFSEIWIIDHSTTTAGAAGHTSGLSGMGGDILYRWGNPMSYGRGTLLDKKFYGQHNAQWIKPGIPEAGKILVFNNGQHRTPLAYSTIEIINPPIDVDFHYAIDTVNAFLPDTAWWNYTAPNPTDFYSVNISGVTPTANSSYVICSGADGNFFEINGHKEIVWRYINPFNASGAVTQGNSPPVQNQVFRSNFYPPSYPAFAGIVLSPYGEIELNPTSPSICDQLGVGIAQQNEPDLPAIYPNPTTGKLNFNLPTSKNFFDIEVFNGHGQRVMTERNRSSLDIGCLLNGIYFIRLKNDGQVFSEKIVKH